VKPKLLVLHGERHFNRLTHAESPAVRERFDVFKSQRVTGRPDVVYCQSYAQSRGPLMKWGGPSMVIVGGNPWHEFPLMGFPKRVKTFKAIFEHATTVATLSRFLAKQIRPKLKTDNVRPLPAGLWGVDHVDNGVRPARFPPKKNWRIESDRPVAITSIKLDNTPLKRTKWQGIPKFLRAVKDVAKKHNVKFVDSARGDLAFSELPKWRRYGFEYVRHHHLDDSFDAWPGMLKSSDVFFYPSEYDGWGRVVADAMCAAVPCMVFNRTAPPEIGKSLLLCDPRDPEGIAERFEHLLVDEDFRRSVAARHYLEAMTLTEEHRGDIADMLMDTLERGSR